MLVLNLIKPAPRGLSALIKSIAAALNQELQAEGVINIKLIDSRAMSSLNKQYAGDDYATDVLSFNYTQSTKRREKELGDVVINFEQARVQAERYGLSEIVEMANLSLHGVLHVLGHDHQSVTEQAALGELQRHILTKAKVLSREFEWVLN